LHAYAPVSTGPSSGEYLPLSSKPFSLYSGLFDTSFEEEGEREPIESGSAETSGYHPITTDTNATATEAPSPIETLPPQLLPSPSNPTGDSESESKSESSVPSSSTEFYQPIVPQADPESLSVERSSTVAHSLAGYDSVSESAPDSGPSSSIELQGEDDTSSRNTASIVQESGDFYAAIAGNDSDAAPLPSPTNVPADAQSTSNATTESDKEAYGPMGITLASAGGLAGDVSSYAPMLAESISSTDASSATQPTGGESIRTTPTAEAANTDVDRNWNEEFQRLLELPVESLQDRLVKAKRIDRLCDEFSAMATECAKVIISELGLGQEQKTIKQLQVGGIAGGDKFKHKVCVFCY
jgi:hypothetical protein